jgi:hypothetical protein
MLLKNAALESGWGWPVKEFFINIGSLMHGSKALRASREKSVLSTGSSAFTQSERLNDAATRHQTSSRLFSLIFATEPKLLHQ